MNHYRLAFHRSKWGDGDIIDNGIVVTCRPFNWLAGPYSHVETWMPDEHGEYMDEDGTFLGRCFTSTRYGDYDGTVVRPAHEVIGRHYERWDITTKIEVDEKQCRAILDYVDYETMNNEGYDIPCILTFFLWRIHSPEKNICSEVAQFVCHLAGLFKKLKLWSPMKLSRKVKKAGVKIYSLTKWFTLNERR